MTQPERDGEIGSKLDLILHKGIELVLGVRCRRFPAVDSEEQRTTLRKSFQAGERPSASEIGCVASLKENRPEAHAETKQMPAGNQTRDVLHIDAALSQATVHLRPTRVQSAEHDDGGTIRKAYGLIGIIFELKTKLV